MLHIDRARLWQDLETLGNIGKGERGRTRPAFSREDLEGRQLLVRWLNELGMEVRMDAYANIWGIRKGQEDLDPIIVGSHIDTVREAGMFDGCLGVLAGLAAVRALNEAGVQTKRPIAVLSFSDEEGARFLAGGLSGSRLMAGLTTLEVMKTKTDADGISWADAMLKSGFVGRDTLKPHAYIEYHIEQGPILADKGITIGVVEGIVNLTWKRFTFKGQANHAGAFPMNRRRDAGLAAAYANIALNRFALEIGENTVITPGQISQRPNLPNIVPAEVVMTVDMRQFKPELFAKINGEIDKIVRAEAEKVGVSVEIEELLNAQGAVFNEDLVDMVERHAEKLGYSNMRMPSGAGHDAQVMNRLCPTAMIFCPSVDGRSHCPEEFTSIDDVGAGADVLLNCLAEMAQK